MFRFKNSDLMRFISHHFYIESLLSQGTLDEYCTESYIYNMIKLNNKFIFPIPMGSIGGIYVILFNQGFV